MSLCWRYLKNNQHCKRQHDMLFRSILTSRQANANTLKSKISQKTNMLWSYNKNLIRQHFFWITISKQLPLYQMPRICGTSMPSKIFSRHRFPRDGICIAQILYVKVIPLFNFHLVSFCLVSFRYLYFL